MRADWLARPVLLFHFALHSRVKRLTGRKEKGTQLECDLTLTCETYDSSGTTSPPRSRMLPDHGERVLLNNKTLEKYEKTGDGKSVCAWGGPLAGRPPLREPPFDSLGQRKGGVEN